MRRPLCAAVLLFVLTVRIMLAVSPPEPPGVPDGRLAEAAGILEKIERSGEEDSWRLTVRPSSLRTLPEGRETDSGGRILCEFRRPQGSGDNGEDAATPAGLRVGQTVTVQGRCRRFAEATNPGQFDVSLYYHILGYSFRMKNARITEASETYDPLRDGLARLRESLSDYIGQCFSAEEAALVRAMLLGERRGEPMQKDLFEGIGLFRLLGVSSLQIALLGSALFSLLRRRGAPAAVSAAAAGTAVCLYAQMTGGGVAVVRACLLFTYRMAARILHRTPDLLTGTALAVLLLLWQQPLYLLYDGFLYTVTAVLAAAVLVPCAADRAQGAAAVPLAIMPLQMRTNGMLSAYGAAMYLLSVPAATIVVLSGGAALLPAAASNLLAGALDTAGAGRDSLFLPVCTALMLTARAAALPAELVLRGMTALSRLAARLPGYAVITGRAGPVQTVLFYLLLLMTAVPWKRRRRIVNGAVLAAAAAILLYRAPLRGLEIDFLDVGQGDGIILRTEGACVMIDGGSSSAEEIGGTVLLPFLRAEGVRRIDAMVLTHPDIDHYSGMLELLEGAEGPIPEREDGTWVLPNGLEVGVLLLPDLDSRLRTEGYRLLEETAARKRIPVRYLARGDTLSAGDLQLTCLHPEPGGMYESTNAGSTVLLAEYGDFSCLLTGDLEKDGEEQCLACIRNSADLLRKAARLACLKVAHHGSRFATGEAWLSVIDAQLAVISCGRDNLYGHPAPETVRRLREDGCEIRTTAELGCVRLRTVGETVGIVFGNTNWYH